MKVHLGKYPKNSELDRIERVEIHSYDLWNLDGSLALIIAPALVKFKEQLDGEFAGIPTNLFDELPGEGDYDSDKNDSVAMQRWKDILDKMIWSFTEIAEGHPSENNFFTFPDDIADDLKLPANKTHFDKDGYQAYQDRIQEGVELFGVHFQSLWT